MKIIHGVAKSHGGTDKKYKTKFCWTNIVPVQIALN